MDAVTFPNGPISMAGNLYFPPDFEPQRSHAALVTVHPGGGVKEQTAGLYASKLADQGYVTLAFDASDQGDSGGARTIWKTPPPASRSSAPRSTICPSAGVTRRAINR